MNKRYSQKRLQSIGDILFSVLKRRGLGTKLEENKLFKLWPQAVGTKIAAQTKPESLRAGTLFVRTTSSVWVQQLHFMKEDIRRSINELAGKTPVQDIHFTVGYSPEHSASPNFTQEAGKHVLKERDKKMIDECTAKLADRELADILKRVMRKEIIRRRLSEEH